MISAILLAAGESRRMGRCKPLLELRGKTFLQTVLDTLARSKVDEVVLVVGLEAERVIDEVGNRRIKVVVNREFGLGMSSSIKAGLRSLNTKSEAFLIMLCDQPLVTAEALDAMIDRFRNAGSRIVLPTYRGIRGNPVLFHRSLIPEIMGLRGDVGAKSIVNKHANWVSEVPVENEGILIDVDTREEYLRLVREKP